MLEKRAFTRPDRRLIHEFIHSWRRQRLKKGPDATAFIPPGLCQKVAQLVWVRIFDVFKIKTGWLDPCIVEFISNIQKP